MEGQGGHGRGGGLRRVQHVPNVQASPAHPPSPSHLVHEQHAGDKLCHPLVHIAVDSAVHLLPQLVRDLSLLGLEQLRWV